MPAIATVKAIRQLAIDDAVDGELRRVAADPDDVVWLRGEVGEGRTGSDHRQHRRGGPDDSEFHKVLFHWRSLRSVVRADIVLMADSLSLDFTQRIGEPVTGFLIPT